VDFRLFVYLSYSRVPSFHVINQALFKDSRGLNVDISSYHYITMQHVANCKTAHNQGETK